MRLVSRFSMLLIVAGLARSQSLTDAAGVLAGSSVGVGAAKPVGQGVGAVLQSVSSTANKAAKTEKPASAEKTVAINGSAKAGPRAGDSGGSGGSGGTGGGGTVLKTGPGGVVKDHSLVPPPPVKKVAVVPPPPPMVPAIPAIAAPVFVLPPPPQVTPEELKTLAKGSSREDVLKFGAPSSRITMMDDGHLVEIFRYQTRETTVGVVRLSDGSVSSVEVR